MKKKQYVHDKNGVHCNFFKQIIRVFFYEKILFQSFYFKMSCLIHVFLSISL